MRHGAEFTLAVRTGTRAGRPRVVGHLLVREDEPHRREPARVGFVVSRAVGSAVTRNRVKRQLRALVRGYLQLLPGVAFLWCAQMPQPRTQAIRISPRIWTR